MGSKKPSASHRRCVYNILNSNRCKWWRPSEIALAHSLARLSDPTLPVLVLLDVERVLAWYASQGFAVGSGSGSYQYRYLTPRAERDAEPTPSTDMAACV